MRQRLPQNLFSRMLAAASYVGRRRDDVVASSLSKYFLHFAKIFMECIIMLSLFALLFAQSKGITMGVRRPRFTRCAPRMTCSKLIFEFFSLRGGVNSPR